MGAQDAAMVKTIPPRHHYPPFHRNKPITHLEAREAARRLINSHFGNTPHAKMSIPVQSDDDDVLIVDYIEQQMLKGGE